MRLGILLAGLLILLPLPALADVTAHYSAGPKDRVTIEADDGGSVHAIFGDKFAVIRRDGVDYILVMDAVGDFRVGRLADVFALVAGQLKARAATESARTTVFELRPGAEETVAGYSGMIWFLDRKQEPGKPNNQGLVLVISNDVALAPIGAFFRRLIGIGAPMIGMTFGGDAGNFATVADELIGKGTPIRVGPLLKLESVDTKDVPASHFDLPGPVLEPIEFLQAVSPSESGGGLPELP